MRVLRLSKKAIEEGIILHILAPAPQGSTKALPRLDCTVGCDARGGWLVVRYDEMPAGVEERFATSDAALLAVGAVLGPRCKRALMDALDRAYPEERIELETKATEARERRAEERRLISQGENLRQSFGHRPGIGGSLFGPMGGGHSPPISALVAHDYSLTRRISFLCSSRKRGVHDGF